MRVEYGGLHFYALLRHSCAVVAGTPGEQWGSNYEVIVSLSPEKLAEFDGDVDDCSPSSSDVATVETFSGLLSPELLAPLAVAEDDAYEYIFYE
jgi:hypothetical protein